jgi:cysteine synthase A
MNTTDLLKRFSLNIPPAPLIPVPDELNPFVDDDLEISISLAGCGAPGEQIKFWSALGMLENALARGVLQKTKRLIEATSGSTGLALASLAPLPPFNVPNVELVTQPDLAVGKRGPLILHGATCIDPIDGQTAIATARMLGGGGWKETDGWGPNEGRLNLDQYGNLWNAKYHRERTGPDILAQERGIRILCAGIGTGGTIIGISDYLRAELGNRIKIVGVLCKPGQKIPGVRDEDRMKEITLPWRQALDVYYEVGTVASYLMTQWLLWLTPYSFGPSTGFALVGGLLHVHHLKETGALDDVPRNEEGKISMIVVSPDTYRPYIDHFHADLPADFLRRSTAPLPWKLLW